MSKSETAPATILVVDDYPGWLARVRSMLQAVPEWKIIFEAADGQEGVRKAAELHPDIVLLDIGLPHLNGIEAAKQIRQDSPESKVIFVTTNSIPDIKTAAMETGAVAYVLKQNAATELIAAIAAALHDCPLELSAV
jgi:two-component system nitrate/nitrite response regulator NarL